MTTAPDSQRSFLSYVDDRNLAAARLANILVAVLMPAGVSLDWFTHREHVGYFLLLRIVASIGCLVVLAASYAKSAKRWVFALALLPLLFAAISIEMMILRIEGFSSPYYAGFTLCLLGISIVVTWTLARTIIASALILAIWVVPALVEGPQKDFGAFFNNLYFLVLISFVAVFSNEARYRQIRREFEARQEVARTSEKLAGALAKLRELDRIKNEFFANISHELRTPLTLILTPVDARLGEAGLGHEERGFLEVVRRNAQRLLRLIDDLLDLARIDAGRLRLSIGQVDLRALAEQSAAAFRPAAEARSIDLQVKSGRPTTDTFGDPHRLEIVLTNLLGNALKFTPDGGKIRVRVEQDENGARVSVQDTGPGIASDELPKIFERFHQVEGDARRKHEGAGIGLALARELCELHGGRIWAESEPGKGSTFTLEIPIGRDHFRPEVIERRKVTLDVAKGRRATDIAAIPGANGESAEPSALEVPQRDEEIVLEGGRRARIVIAEDNEDLREFLRSLLAPSYEVIAAADGAEALELVREHKPDLVVSDVMMPRMTGTELCNTIKADPILQNTPVILLTARSGSEAVVEGYAFGADDFVNKPFHPRILLARIRAQLRIRALGFQLASQAKLAAVGTLAAGIGHEVRNPVNAVLNGARALLAKPTVEPSTRRVLEVVEEAAKRIEGISRALLDHAHPAEHDRPRPCDVRSGLDATLRLLAHRMNQVSVHTSYGTERNVVAAAAELNQVFLNLLDNAIRSSASNVWVRTLEADGKLQVIIDDDGPGVPEEIANRIFDPFFTTRGPGEGTGLGLYLSSRIVARYGGALRLGTRPGGGASFTVELPAEAA